VVLARWLAFVDADGAVSAAEVARVLGLVCETGKAAGYFASRNREAGKTIRRRWPRGQLGCVFAWLAGRLLGLKTHDSQCGFKVVEREWFRRIDARVRELGFCFDLDVWLALREQGAKVAEVPVDWQERAGGKLKLWRDGAGMLRQLWCLRKKYQVGKSGGVGH
jgi:hypothetical protein